MNCFLVKTHEHSPYYAAENANMQRVFKPSQACEKSQNIASVYSSTLQKIIEGMKVKMDKTETLLVKGKKY